MCRCTHLNACTCIQYRRVDASTKHTLVAHTSSKMDGGEDVIPAPTIPRSQDRKDVVLALKDIFMLEGRTFQTMSSCSHQVNYKCGGCNLTFALSLCQRRNALEFGTWGLTKKSRMQSWKVCTFFTYLFCLVRVLWALFPYGTF